MAIVLMIGALLLLVMAWCSVMLWRNNKVRDYALEMLDKAYEANLRTINDAYAPPIIQESLEASRRICDARWAWASSPNYNTMVLRFWKPLDSFYGPMPDGESETS